MDCCCSSFSYTGHDDYTQIPMSPGVLLDPQLDERELLLFEGSGFDAVNLSLLDDGLAIVRRRKDTLGRAASTLRISKASSSSLTTIPYLNVLSASASPAPDGGMLVKISAVKSNSNKSSSKLWALEGQVRSAPGEGKAREWVAALERLAFGKANPRRRRLLVLVNPHGGQGKAKETWEAVARPIFEAAGCPTTLHYTGPSGSPTNATSLAQGLDLHAFDAVVTVSGDGVVHEFLNGLASREDAVAALRIPLLPIPAGSGNALNVNLHGPRRATDRAWAALSAVKGSVIPLDLCSVTQNGERRFAFLSMAFGLMADIDLGTEDMRWMGDSRFTLGYIGGSLARREYPIEITLKVVESDKNSMVSAYNEALRQHPPVLEDDPARDSHIPPLRFGSSEVPLPGEIMFHEEIPTQFEPGWHTIRSSLFFLYAGLLPFVAKDVKMFPPARDDGLIDLVMVKPRSRIDSLLAMDGADSGKIYWNPAMRYVKVECFRLTPLSPSGYISIDGESVPHAPFQVESHPRLARTISLSGRLFGEELELPGK